MNNFLTKYWFNTFLGLSSLSYYHHYRIIATSFCLRDVSLPVYSSEIAKKNLGF